MQTLQENVQGDQRLRGPGRRDPEKRPDHGRQAVFREADDRDQHR